MVLPLKVFTEIKRYETFSCTWLCMLLLLIRNRNSAVTRFAAELLTWIYDNNLPLCIQVFKSSHLSPCKPGVLPADQMGSRWCKSISKRRMESPVNIHSERCYRICSSLTSCFVIYKPLNIIQQKEKSRMQAWPSLALLKFGCLCPVTGLTGGSWV